MPPLFGGFAHCPVVCILLTLCCLHFAVQRSDANMDAVINELKEDNTHGAEEKKEEKPTAAPQSNEPVDVKPVTVVIRVRSQPQADWPDANVVAVKQDTVTVPNVTMPGMLSKGNSLIHFVSNLLQRSAHACCKPVALTSR